MKRLCEQCGQKDCGFVNRGFEDDCERAQLYEQGYDDAVEKAVGWLESVMLNDDIYGVGDNIENLKELINDLKKAMNND